MTQLRVSIYQLHHLWPPLAALRMSHLNHDITIMRTLRQTGLVLSRHPIHKYYPGIRGTAQSHTTHVNVPQGKDCISGKGDSVINQVSYVFTINKLLYHKINILAE